MCKDWIADIGFLVDASYSLGGHDGTGEVRLCAVQFVFLHRIPSVSGEILVATPGTYEYYYNILFFFNQFFHFKG